MNKDIDFNELAKVAKEFANLFIDSIFGSRYDSSGNLPNSFKKFWYPIIIPSGIGVSADNIFNDVTIFNNPPEKLEKSLSICNQLFSDIKSEL